MKNRTKWLAAGLLGAVTLVGMGAGAAKEAAGHERPLMKFIQERMGKATEMGKELGVTDEQKKQIKEAVAPFRDQMRQEIKVVVEKRQALRDAVTAPGANEGAIRAAAEQVGKAAGDAAVTASKIYAAVKPILTPEQVKKLDEFKKNNREAVDKFLDGAGKD